MQKILKIFIIMLFMFNIHTDISYCESVGEVTIFVGEEVELDAMLVKNHNISEKASVTWKTGDGSIASFTSNGKIIGVKEGRTYVSANVNSDEKNTSAIVIINVKSSVESLDFTSDTVSMILGDIYYPSYNIIPKVGAKVYNDKIKLVSKDPSVAYINSDNGIVGVKKGYTEIYGYTEDGNKIDKFKLEVVEGYKKIFFKNLKMDDVFYVGEKLSLQLIDDKGNDLVSPVIFKVGPTRNQISITNRGEVEFLQEGTVRIDCITFGEKRAAATVHVKTMVDSVKIDKRNITFSKIGDVDQLRVKIIPVDTEKGILVDSIKWSSSNSSVVAVDSTGALKAIGYGYARITAQTTDGGKTDSMSVEVTDGKKIEKKITKILVKPSKNTSLIGEEVPLEVTIIPEDAENKSINFSIESGGGAVTQKDGLYYYKGNSLGLSKIKAVAVNGPEAKFEVTVKSPLKDFVITDQMLKYRNIRTLYMGQETELTVELNPKYGFSVDEIFEKGYNVTLSNSNLSVKDKNDTSFKLVANSPGFTNVTITTVDKTNTVIIPVRIENLVEKISIKKEDNVPVGQKYTPEVILTQRENVYNLSEVQNKEYTISIIESFVLRDYIQNEIDYERATLNELEELIKSDPRKYGNLKTETQAKKDRINTFEKMLLSSSGGYIKLVGSSGITDRLGSTLKIATEDDKNITGITRGYILYQVKSKDGEKTALSKLYFTSQVADLVITKDDNIISASDDELKKQIEEKANSEETKVLNNRIEKRFGDSSESDIPTRENIETILNLEESISLSSILKGAYKSTATREHTYQLAINIFESYLGFKFKEPDNVFYKDDTTGISTKAYNIGIANMDKERMAYPNSPIDIEYLKNILKKLSISLDKKKSVHTVDSDLKTVPKDLLDQINNRGYMTIEELLVIANYVLR